MALSNYEELIEAVQDSAHRKDLLNRIPRFISLAENEFYSNPDEILKMREFEKTSFATTNGTRFLELPENFLMQRDFKITIDTQEYDLKYVTPNAMVVKNYTGAPHFFTVTNEIELDRVPDQDYDVTIKYFSESPALSEAQPTNEVLTLEPNVYLYGVLKQVFIWSQDIEESIVYDGLFTDAIKGANRKYNMGRYGATPTIKLKQRTP